MTAAVALLGGRMECLVLAKGSSSVWEVRAHCCAFSFRQVSCAAFTKAPIVVNQYVQWKRKRFCVSKSLCMPHGKRATCVSSKIYEYLFRK